MGQGHDTAPGSSLRKPLFSAPVMAASTNFQGIDVTPRCAAMACSIECAVAFTPVQASGKASGVRDETSIGCGGILRTAVFEMTPAGGNSPLTEAGPLVNQQEPAFTAVATASIILPSGQRGMG